MGSDVETSKLGKRRREQSSYEELAKRQRTSPPKREQTVRRSSRLNRFIREEPSKHLPLAQKADTREQPARRIWLTTQNSQPKGLKRARSLISSPTEPSSKRLRQERFNQEATDCSAGPKDPIRYWVHKRTWPTEYFQPDNMLNNFLVRKKSNASMRRKRSDSIAPSSTTASDLKPRDNYNDVRYEALLEQKGSFMDEFEQGVSETSKVICLALLKEEQSVPQDSLFRDDIFDLTCRKLRGRNETRVIRDISLLLVPSADTLATYGAKELDILVESTNEAWSNCIPLTKTRPQPDYSVGFRREAFSEIQQKKLTPFLGDFLAGDQCYFMATYYMFFPFLTCEVKCGAAALDMADRQNAHSMSLAVRAIVELFRLVKREKAIHREVLGFSITHNNQCIRISGHYAVINGCKTSFYRHPIHNFDFTALGGKDKWTTHKFIKNVYYSWMPTHFKRLCAAIDELPLGEGSETDQSSGLSQDIELHRLSGPDTQADDLNSQLDTTFTTPDTSFTQQGPTKRQRGRKPK